MRFWLFLATWVFYLCTWLLIAAGALVVSCGVFAVFLRVIAILERFGVGTELAVYLTFFLITLIAISGFLAYRTVGEQEGS